MYTTRLTLALIIAALAGCTTVSETQPAASETPAVATEAVPAPAPTATEAITPAPKPEAKPAKRRPIKSRAATPVPVAATPAPKQGASEQEIAAAMTAVDEALKRLVLEQMQFTTPAAMKLNERGSATLLFQNPGSLEEVRTTLATNELIRRAQVQITDRVQAQLSGEGVGVKGNGAEVQTLTAPTPGQWTWELQPVSAGKAKVHLRVSFETSVDGAQATRAVHTIDREIAVEAAAPTQAGFGFSWIWWVIGFVVAAVGVWWVRRRKA